MKPEPLLIMVYGFNMAYEVANYVEICPSTEHPAQFWEKIMGFQEIVWVG